MKDKDLLEKYARATGTDGGDHEPEEVNPLYVKSFLGILAAITLLSGAYSFWVTP
jgi:hypothetical protein